MSDANEEVVIVGAGIAGLSLALYLAERNPQLKIRVMSKDVLPECNTNLAQGGIAIVTDQEKDSFSSHVQDTMMAGRGHSDRQVVEAVVREAPARLEDLLRWNVDFDTVNGAFDLHQEGGHSVHRILHHKDFTGHEIHQKLMMQLGRHSGIEVMQRVFVTDLLVKDNVCHGVSYFTESDPQPVVLRAQSVVLATGGIGQIFPFTTNSRCATGDGVAMAYRAGAGIKDLQYYQFHPTALYSQGSQARLISEAVRGFGAYVVNEQGKRFLFEYDPRGELATRDIVTNAINQEMRKSGAKCVYLSISHLDPEAFARHFPAIWKQCLEAGVNPAEDNIPIVPAAHYQCGGISVDLSGHTSVRRLYAVGECACTGLHGTNRLASNSLLEALVFSYRVAEDVLSGTTAETLSANDALFETATEEVNPSRPSFDVERERLQNTIFQAFQQKEDTTFLAQTLAILESWREALTDLPNNRDAGEYRNMLDCALVLTQALLADQEVSCEG